MNILIIGANGKVGRRLVRLLAAKYTIFAMIRSEDQVSDMKHSGAVPLVLDLEKDFSSAFAEKDAVIFTAGSGSSTGPDKTITVDQEGAIKSMDYALKFGVNRYIMVSAQGVREPELPSKIQHYYKAKAIADNYLINSNLDYTIFRPGRLLDTMGNGLITAKEYIESRGSTVRDNLAAAIAYSVFKPNTYRKIIEILEGETPVQEAMDAI